MTPSKCPACIQGDQCEAEEMLGENKTKTQ